MERPYRDPEEIADLINNHHYYENNVGALEAYIMTDFTVAEIRSFAHFLRGEDWSPYDPEWHRDTSSYVKLTWISHDRLTLFFDRLVRISYLYMGAASVLKINGSQLLPLLEIATTDKLLDYTLDALIRLVPAEYRKQLDAASRLDDIKGLVEASKAQGDRIEKKVGETRRDQLTRAHYDRVNDIKPKTRSSGGGRKQKRDLDDKQVKAVVALSPATHPRPIMECCAEVIRKGGKYKDPYTDAKNLAAAVRRYGKRTKTKLTFKARSGRWSAKS